MSKHRSSFHLIPAILCVILHFLNTAAAQDIDVRLKVDPDGLVTISGKNASPQNGNFFFIKDFGGIEIPGERVSNVVLKDVEGNAIGVRRLAPGEFLASGEFISWSYSIRPEITMNTSSAHISWIGTDEGILMLDDLLPKFKGERVNSTAKVIIDVPPGWKTACAEKQSAENAFEVADVEKAVIFLGKNWREKSSAGQKVILSGEWRFTDDEAARITGEIFSEYENLFGGRAPDKFQVLLLKLPTGEKFGVWDAETRGKSVTIVSSDMPFETQSIQMLHEQLRHEIFHLWIPNGVNLSGSYDWFYEGFALYEALRTGVNTNRISFDNFLDTLSRAINIDSAQTTRTSLIEASKNRWTGANTQIYARGMLVAFLCDVELIRNSKGKTGIPDILREIYTAHTPPAGREDGNAVILALLEKHGLKRIVDSYIRGTEDFRWKTELDPVGIEAGEANFIIRLKVKPKPGGRQKEFLDKLGYNNWRKLLRNSK